MQSFSLAQAHKKKKNEYEEECLLEAMSLTSLDKICRDMSVNRFFFVSKRIQNGRSLRGGKLFFLHLVWGVKNLYDMHRS